MATDLDGEEKEVRQQLQADLELWNSLARQRLLASQEARKRSEADYQLLANRLRLLRSEHQKALRLIEETRKRTREVLGTRQQRVLDAEMHLEQSDAKALEQKRQENNWRRTQARFARQKAADELVQANRRCVMELRAQSTPRSASTTSTASVASRKAPKAEDLAATAANEARQLREEKELLRRLRQADARSKRPPLPPLALEDEGPIREALREASLEWCR